MTCHTRFQEHSSPAIRSAVGLALLGAFLARPVDADMLADCPVASDAQLGELRGGLNVGPLIANFAIERVVRINGELVARTLLIVDFSKVASGGMPDLRVIGDLALLIQVGPGNSTAGSDPGALPGALITPASNDAMATAIDGTAIDGTAMADQIVASTLETAGIETLPVATSASSSGVTSASGVSAGSQEQFGAALVTAVDTVTGGGALTMTAPSMSESAGLTALEGAAPSATPVAVADTARPVVPATANPSLAPALTPAEPVPASMTVRPMDTSPAIVIFNIPDGNTLATAIQNSVAATHIETQTIISATLNSLAPLQSGAFADALRQQILRATGP